MTDAFFNIVGAVFLVSAGYLYGCNISSVLVKRVRLLEELLMALELFRTEIDYGLTPLPQAFRNIGSRVEKPLGDVFLKCSSYMQKNEGLSAWECWNKALGETQEYLKLSPSSLEYLRRLGNIWGRGDKEGQLRQLSLMQELFRQALKEAQEHRNKNEKLWRYLGLIGGAALAIFIM